MWRRRLAPWRAIALAATLAALLEAAAAAPKAPSRAARAAAEAVVSSRVAAWPAAAAAAHEYFALLEADAGSPTSDDSPSNVDEKVRIKEPTPWCRKVLNLWLSDCCFAQPTQFSVKRGCVRILNTWMQKCVTGQTAAKEHETQWDRDHKSPPWKAAK